MTTLIIAGWVIWIPLLIVSVLKGKPWLGIFLGIIGAGIGAIRLAKPGSWWARHYYDPRKLALARDRHGDERPRDLSQVPVGWQ